MMRVIRWKNASTGVESLNITATGIYFPVGKTDSSFIARYSMASAGQTASVERVSSPDGSRVGSPAVNVSGTTEVVVNERRGLSTGIIVTAISGTLISVLDDNTPITNFPDAGLGRFPAKEDADAYVYGSTVPQGISAIINGVPYSWGAARWVVASAIVLASVKSRNDTTSAAGTVAYPLMWRGAQWIIPANTLGPNGQFTRVCFDGYFNINHVGSSASTQTSFRMFCNAEPAPGVFFIAESVPTASPTGLTSRYGKIECEIVWNSGDPSLSIPPGVQCIVKTYGLFSMNGFDSFRDLDTFESATPHFDPTINNVLYPGFRIQNPFSDVILGSRMAMMYAE